MLQSKTVSRGNQLQLKNGCHCSYPSIYPTNWNLAGASISCTWYIHYRFYDPAYKKDPKIKGSKLVIIKGVNHHKDLASRREAIKTILDNELDLLINRNYNPISKACMTVEAEFEISPDLPWVKAIRNAIQYMTISPLSRRECEHYASIVTEAAEVLRIADVPINEIRRRHIKTVLEYLLKKRKRWTGNSYNACRTKLKMMFSMLIEMETIEFDPTEKIKKQKTIHKVRQTLTMGERILVNDHLKNKYYTFWRYLQIFFHSGSRTTELFRLQGKHVDLKRQQVMISIKKGKSERQEWRPIKDIAKNLWSEIMLTCGPEDYIFSKGLQPGIVPITAIQISRRWRNHVKAPKEDGGLGITADFYSLKHLNIDETTEQLSIQDAAKMAGHTSTVITMKHYATGEKDRQNERLKKVSNSFSG